MQEQSQAAPGVLVRAGIVRSFKQFATCSDASQSTRALTSRGRQTGPAIACGGDVLVCDLSPCFVVGEECAIGLCTDQTHLGIRNRLGKRRGDSHSRIAQPSREVEQCSSCPHPIEILEGRGFLHAAPRVEDSDDSKCRIRPQKVPSGFRRQGLQQTLHHFENGMLRTLPVVRVEGAVQHWQPSGERSPVRLCTARWLRLQVPGYQQRRGVDLPQALEDRIG